MMHPFLVARKLIPPHQMHEISLLNRCMGLEAGTSGRWIKKPQLSHRVEYYIAANGEGITHHVRVWMNCEDLMLSETN